MLGADDYNGWQDDTCLLITRQHDRDMTWSSIRGDDLCPLNEEQTCKQIHLV